MSTVIRRFEINICDDCINLCGEMCNNPRCFFCRRTMQEVSEYLDALLIRPIVDGKHIPEVLNEVNAFHGEVER